MALLAIKFQDILISIYSSVVPLLGSLSFQLPLEELKETISLTQQNALLKREV